MCSSDLPQGPEGTPWGDPAVEEAAAVAVAVGPEWKSLGFTECRPVGRHGLRRWELVGPASRTIVFGAAPGREAQGEPSAAAKIAMLKTLAADPSAAAAGDLIDLTKPDAVAQDGTASAAAAPPAIPAP